MAVEYQIGTLWIGGALSYLEQLCLKSFVDAGQHIRLYTYGPVGNVPDGVEVADASRILPLTTILRHTRTGSPAPQADRFRYHMLAQCDRTIWADTDAYCVRPFTTPNGHFHAWESETRVNNGVLGLPRDSATLAGLLDFTRDPYAIPPWFEGEERARLEAARDAGRPLHAGEMAWGVWGPQALTHFLKATGEIRFSMPRVTLYPFAYKDRRLMLRPNLDASRYVTDETFSIHFYGRRMRARLLSHENGVPKPRSLIGRLLRKHGIDPAAAPLRAEGAPAAPAPA
jgi:hypothetical protein